MRVQYDQAMTPSAPYPLHWEADVVLRDGSTMSIRPIRPDDASALQAMHLGQSERSRYFRFFAPMAHLSDSDLHRFTNVDHKDRVALVLTLGEEIVAVGRYDRIIGDEEFPDDDVAEVAFYVSDRAQGRGLGSILLEHLAAAGRERGIRRFVADVLPANTRMLRVFSDAGYDVKKRFDDGVVSVNFTIRPTDKSMKVLAERERRAESLSMARILGAESILLYGSGSEGSSLVAVIAERVAQSDFSGSVHLLADLAELEQMLAERSEPLDLAVIGAPAEEVMDLIPVLGKAGTGAVLIPTGGFAATESDTEVPLSELLARVREHGIRLVGPRSYGIIAQSDKGALPATLAPKTPRTGAGGIGIFCQSGHAARTLLAGAKERNLTVSTALASGHRADVSGNDTMQLWASKDDPHVAIVHLESIGNPRKFSRVARYLAEQRPVIATVAGSTGQVRPPGHPVRESHAPRRALDELMNQAGVLRARSIPQALDWAATFSTQPLPAGPRVAVLGNSGTHVAVLQEHVRATGLTVVDGVPAFNPVAGSEEYRNALDDLASRQDWDALVVIYGAFLGDDGSAVARAIAEFATTQSRPVLASVPGYSGIEDALTSGETRVPGFVTGEDAIAAVAAMLQFSTHRDQDAAPRVDPPGIDRRTADSLVASHLAILEPGETRKLSADDAADLLATYGLDVLRAREVESVEDAIAAATEIGWPVALKTSDVVLRHRADLGGVRLDLTSEAELRQAYEAMSARIESLGRGQSLSYEVQAMAPAGAACVLIGAEDPLYGPIMSFGLGGDAIELLDDVSYRVPPLTEDDVRSLITSVKAAPRLLGHRDLPPLDIDRLVDTAARLSVLKEEVAAIKRIELNPVLVAEDSLAIISGEVWIAHPERGDISRRVLPK